MSAICRPFQSETNPPKQQSIDEGVLLCKYQFQTIFTSTIRCLTYPTFTTYYKIYMFSFVNLLIIARPTKRCIIVRDFSFD